MTNKTYTFTITLQGTGLTVEDAWMDALVEFHSDPGGVPDDEDTKLIFEVEDEELFDYPPRTSELFEDTIEKLDDLVNIRTTQENT